MGSANAPTSETSSAVDFGILGPIVVVSRAGTLHLTAKQRILLVRLLLGRNVPVPADYLVDALFPDAQPQNPPAALHNHVSRLRRSLAEHDVAGSGLLVRHEGGYRLDVRPEQVDAVRFEGLANSGRVRLDEGDPVGAAGLLQSALSLWRGPALADVAFTEFAAAEAARLEERRLGAQEDLAAARVANGEAREVAEELEALAQQHPLRERLATLLMTALARSGRQAEALRASLRLRETLDREVGLTPSAEVDRLELAILRQDAGLGPARFESGQVHQGQAPAQGPPAPATRLGRLVGRREERREVMAAVRRGGLVTIAGMGGVGKTRLALEVAADGPSAAVSFVDLSTVAGPDQVPAAVAAAVGAPDDKIHHLVDAAGARLLVLDSCEHVAEAVATLVASLLRTCTELSVLVTSRQPLGVEGEVVHRLGPLATPAPGADGSVEAVASSEAVELFVERARAVQPGFMLTSENAPTTARLCRRLDGVPLSIELAAARLETVTLDEVASVLHDRFGLLSSSSGPVPIRQHDLLRTFDGDEGQLDEFDLLVLRRMSVFEGAVTHEAIARVCCRGGDAERLRAALADLVMATVVVADPAPSGTRYRLVDSVRRQARERLDETGEAVELARRHAAWCLALAEDAEGHLEGTGAPAWLARLDRHHGDLRAALAWTVAASDAEFALRLAGALTLYWELRGHYREGRTSLEQALVIGGPPNLRAKAFLGTAAMSAMLGEHERAAVAAEQAFELYSFAGDGRGVARSLLCLGSASLYRGSGVDQARRVLHDSAEEARASGDVWCLSAALAMAGWSEMHRGAPPRARPLFEEAAVVAQAHDNGYGLELALTGLGQVALAEGDEAGGRRRLSEALALARSLGHEYVQIEILRCLGELEGPVDRVAARALLDDALERARRSGSDINLADCLCAVGRLALGNGDVHEAALFFEEAKTSTERLGMSDGAVLFGLAEVHKAMGDAPQTSTYLTTALNVARAKGNRSAMATALSGLGDLAATAGDTGQAAVLHRHALSCRASVGDVSGMVMSLMCLASLALSAGLRSEAARLGGAAERLRHTSRPNGVDDELSRLHGQLATPELRAAWKEGAASSPEVAAQHADAVAAALQSMNGHPGGLPQRP